MKFYKVRLKSNPKLTLEDHNSVVDLRKWWPTAIGRNWESADGAFKAIHDIRKACVKILARKDIESKYLASWKKQAKQVEDMEVVEYSIPDESASVVTK